MSSWELWKAWGLIELTKVGIALLIILFALVIIIINEKRK